MSVKAAKDFIEQAHHDPTIRKAGRSALDEIVKLGHKHGYQFDRQEFDVAMRERKESGKDKETDEDGPDTCVWCCVGQGD